MIHKKEKELFIDGDLFRKKLLKVEPDFFKTLEKIPLNALNSSNKEIKASGVK